MRLMTIIATNKSPSGGTERSRVLVNMDKFVDAVECNDGLINMWFEGPFSLTVSKSDFADVLLGVGICQRDIHAHMPGSQTQNGNFQAPGGVWGKHIS